MWKKLIKARKAKRKAGFTLVELMVAIGTGAVIIAAVVSMFVTSNQAYVKQEQIVNTEQGIRAAIEVMSHELRMAGYVPEANLSGANTITTDVPGQTWSTGTWTRIPEAKANSITFIADLNADDNAETVRYWVQNSTLWRLSWEWRVCSGALQWCLQNSSETSGPVPGAVAMADRVTALNFIYTFADGMTATTVTAGTTQIADNIRGIEIALTGETFSVTQSSGTKINRTLQSYLKTRNMGLQ